MIMRDYKFRQTELPRRKARRKTLRTMAMILAVAALGLLVFAGLQWRTAEPISQGTGPTPDSRVIPLPIPSPKAADGSSVGPSQPAQPDQPTESRPN
jgi:hypothetical protein